MHILNKYNPNTKIIKFNLQTASIVHTTVANCTQCVCILRKQLQAGRMDSNPNTEKQKITLSCYQTFKYATLNYLKH